MRKNTMAPAERAAGRKKRLALGFLVCLVLSSTGCVTGTFINEVPLKSIREATGQQMSFHTLVAVQRPPSQYDRLVLIDFDNLMLDAVPPERYSDLNREVAAEIARRKIFPQVVRAASQADFRSDNSSTLILEGTLDNYNPGVRSLRAIPEMGLNNATVTIRVYLRDGESRQVLGSTSITVYERGGTATDRTAIRKVARLTADYVARSFGRRAESTKVGASHRGLSAFQEPTPK